jgi:U4/U6.U5 tri-snRNP component SNU23
MTREIDWARLPALEMSQPAKGAANFQRRSWNKEEYEARAKAQQQAIEEAVRSGADEAEATRAVMEAQALVGDQARDAAGTEDELRERAVTALSAREGAAGPLGSQRAFLKRRHFDVAIDNKVGSRKVVTDSTAMNNRGGFYVPVTGVTLRDSLGFLDHINGRKYQRALGFSMRVERKGSDDVREKLRAVKRSREQSELESQLATEALAGGSELLHDAYSRRVDQLEAEAAERREKEREKRRKRKAAKRGQSLSSASPTGEEQEESQEPTDDEARDSPSTPRPLVEESEVLEALGGPLVLAGVYGISADGSCDVALAEILGIPPAPARPWPSAAAGVARRERG